jgi:hypothetical protein
VLAGVAGLLRELLAWNEGAIEADQRAVEALALDEDVQERAPDLTVAPLPMPVAQPAPMGDARGRARSVEVLPATTGTEHQEDPGE